MPCMKLNTKLFIHHSEVHGGKGFKVITDLKSWLQTLAPNHQEWLGGPCLRWRLHCSCSSRSFMSDTISSLWVERTGNIPWVNTAILLVSYFPIPDQYWYVVLKRNAIPDQYGDGKIFKVPVDVIVSTGISVFQIQLDSTLVLNLIWTFKPKLRYQTGLVLHSSIYNSNHNSDTYKYQYETGKHQRYIFPVSSKDGHNWDVST